MGDFLNGQKPSALEVVEEVYQSKQEAALILNRHLMEEIVKAKPSKLQCTSGVTQRYIGCQP